MMRPDDLRVRREVEYAAEFGDDRRQREQLREVHIRFQRIPGRGADAHHPLRTANIDGARVGFVGNNFHAGNGPGRRNAIIAGQS